LAGRGYLFGVMKKWATLLSSIVAGFLFAGCGGEETAATSAATDPTVVAYPLETCLVGDSKLGSMGKPHTFVHEGREIKFCCEGCNDDFKADTAKYIKKFDDAVAAKKAAEAKPADDAGDAEKAG
jgi:hypothetical protein